jgi:hypothetical protein
MYLELVNLAVTEEEVKYLFVNLGNHAAGIPEKVSPLLTNITLYTI